MQVSTLGWKLAVGWKPAGDSGKYSAPTPDIVAVLLSAFGWKPVDTCSSAKVVELGEPKPTMMSSKSVMAMVLRMDTQFEKNRHLNEPIYSMKLLTRMLVVGRIMRMAAKKTTRGCPHDLVWLTGWSRLVGPLVPDGWPAGPCWLSG